MKHIGSAAILIKYDKDIVVLIIFFLYMPAPNTYVSTIHSLINETSEHAGIQGGGKSEPKLEI